MSDSYQRIARDRSLLRIKGTPVATVMLGSLFPAILPIIAVSPAMPPLGLLMLLGWRLLRPEIWPLWIGLLLGLFDDIATGHPVGTAMCLWTLTLVALDLAGGRLLWRDYVQDWLIAAIAIIAVLAMSWAIMALGPDGGGGPFSRILPQMAISILLYPLAARLCARLDRWRLP